MTVVKQESWLLGVLAADWQLESFTAGGVTACCPSDMGIRLAIDGSGAVAVQCGPVHSAGRAMLTGQQQVAFTEMVVAPPPWGPVPTALEDRVAAVLDREWAVSVQQDRLTLLHRTATLRFRRLG
jgi:hypothetical protein